MSAYGGGFIYFFQHYLSSDSMSKLDSRQHCTKTKKDFTVNWNIPFDKQGRWTNVNFEMYMKNIQLAKSWTIIKSFSGVLKDHITKNEHAASSKKSGHYDENKPTKHTHQIVF